MLLGLAAAVLPGCSGSGSGSKSDEDDLSMEGAVPIAYVKRVNTLGANPTNGAPFAAGGDLMVKEMSAPGAIEHNLTAEITQGKGDASDPEVSYNGKKIVFSLKCPTSNTSQVDGVKAWEYDMTDATLTTGKFRRLTSSTDDDDVDPAYLPDGRGFVFSSNRQTTSKTSQALGHSYYALDEYERERVFNLHAMSATGTNIRQLSFNQSHDRNPVVRPNGDIMFSRWDHVGGRNHFKIFRMKPDGTDMFVLYGAHSEGNSFLHPRDMDPSGKYAGFVSSDLMPLSRTNEGGGLVFVDVAHYSEQNTPASPDVPAAGGQSYPTQQVLNIGQGLSRYGRVTTPYPLWDGTDRLLVAYRPCEVHRGTDIVSCATLTEEELTRLSDENRSEAAAAADELKDDVPPPYAIYMFDPAKQTWLNVAAPPAGFMYTDPVPLVSHAAPNVVDPTSVDADLAKQGLGLLEVRSVYDTDGLGRMGEPGHARPGGRHPAPEGSGRCLLPLRPRALHPRRAGRRAARIDDGPARGHRRDRVRAAADPRLRAHRARRLVQAARAGRHAGAAGGGRRAGPGLPDAHQLDPGPTRRTPHLRRLPQPAPRRLAQLRQRGRHHALDAARGAGRPAPVGRDHGLDPHPAGSGRAEARVRHGLRGCLGRHRQGRDGQAFGGHHLRRAGHDSADQRSHQLPRPHPAAVDP
jgi:hypothetical protein